MSEDKAKFVTLAPQAKLADRKYLRITGALMAHQDNRATQYPLYVIQEDERQWVEPGKDYDERERVEDTNAYPLCSDCLELFKNEKELPADCRHCDPEAFDNYKFVEKFALQAGFFFSEISAKEHIKANHYHYRNPRVYVIGAWRNPEMVAIMHFLLELGGEGVPSHYA